MPSKNPDRLPPHSTEAEQGILGCILLAPIESMDRCVEVLTGGAECFYDIRHQEIYRTMLKMHENGESPDVVKLSQNIKDNGKTKQSGGFAYISSLPDTTPSPAMLEYFLDIVTTKWRMRQHLVVCTEGVQSMMEPKGEDEDALAELDAKMAGLQNTVPISRIQAMPELVAAAMDKIDQTHQKGDLGAGLRTGFQDLDAITGGFQSGDLIVIAARPSMGKTSFAMNLVENIADKEQKPAGVFSLEMPSDSLVMRLLASHARVNSQHMRDGRLSEREINALVASSVKLRKAPIFIDDSPQLTILQIAAKARHMVRKHKVEMIAIDYLQRVDGTIPGRRRDEISQITNGLKTLAKELDIPIVVLSQLNRDVEREKVARPPRLSDLSESSSIEADADIVAFLYGPPDSEDAFSKPVRLLIAKHRNGSTGEVRLVFLKPFTRFETVARIQEEDVPAQGNLPYND